jgi:hypothetical protein
MKTIFCIIGACFLFSEATMSQAKEKHESKFEIWDIDSVQTVYLIYAKRNDSIIKIVSKKESHSNCEPILKGKLYELKVESLLKNTASKRHIGGVKYNGILIKLEGEKVVWDLFICDDLKGLCYSPSMSVACKKKRQKKPNIEIVRNDRAP